ncbi:unnamed protein product [Rangifer tarandus platyrhynchus]|uniref:Uncharacterized protein n=1 Tax=Rangifer tarandus platyrhynchus TaxID=3082113 RepID=A0ABN8YRD3_RANTA|nr:unnamed protein product [Rangifer tarandus platyrhynchus]
MQDRRPRPSRRSWNGPRTARRRSEGVAGRSCISPGASPATQDQPPSGTQARGRTRIKSRTPGPARRLRPLASTEGQTARLPAASPARLVPQGPQLPPRPRPGPHEAALPVNSPPGTAHLPASVPPLGGPERRVIGPAAPSLSGRVTALVSDRPETGSGVSARGAAAEGVELPCLLRLARGSAR